jgi:catechol 2,3-dioxygenase-like lactoylglutathione lyase family enzyme
MYGNHHLNVSSVAAHRKFWVDTLGAEVGAPRPGAATVFTFPNATLVLHETPPTGGTKGTTVNHIAFGVPNIRRSVDWTASAGYPIVTRAELPDRFEVRDDLGFIPQLNTFVAFTMGPDDIKVEFLEVPSAAEPIAMHHVHFFSPEADRMKAWYADMFGADARDRGPFPAIDLPGGVNLTFSQVPDQVSGTQGRVLDRIGLVVGDLARYRSGTSAGDPLVIVDPWGTVIELAT